MIQQDRQFLTEVARSLGLPVQDVLRRCLGTTGTAVPTLWSSPELDTFSDLCPWWECHGSGLWRRCPRLRLAPAVPCQIHERSVPGPLLRINSDPHIVDLPWYTPVTWNDNLYWVDPTGDGRAFHEDGRLVTGGTFRRLTVGEERVWAWCPT